MKFIHIADIHLGVEPDAGSSYSSSRPAEIWNSFQRIIEICEKEQTDLLLIAGDLFHRQPLLRELKVVDYLFSTFSKTQVVFVVGNHDYIKKNSYYRTFTWSSNVHALLDEKLSFVELPELDTVVYGLSYYKKEIEEFLFDEQMPESKLRNKILLAHGGDAKHIPFRKENLMAQGYDYIALGHIHKPQEQVPGKMAYAGALEPIDKNDTGVHGYRKGMIINHICKSEFVPFASREYVHMNIEVTKEMTGFGIRSKLNEAIENRGAHHIYKIILNGYRSPELSLDYQALDGYGNIVEIVDETRPAYDFEKLLRLNQENLIGHYIQSFSGEPETSVEYEALCEGISALMETRRGQE